MLPQLTKNCLFGFVNNSLPFSLYACPSVCVCVYLCSYYTGFCCFCCCWRKTKSNGNLEVIVIIKFLFKWQRNWMWLLLDEGKSVAQAFFEQMKYIQTVRCDRVREKQQEKSNKRTKQHNSTSNNNNNNNHKDFVWMRQWSKKSEFRHNYGQTILYTVSVEFIWNWIVQRVIKLTKQSSPFDGVVVMLVYR